MDAVKLNNSNPHESVLTSPKAIYVPPLLTVFGAVHQFTHGSDSSGNADGNSGMPMR